MPSSIKNNDKKRDPDAHQTKKGNAWYFGYKAHVGVDRDSDLVHTVRATVANVHDASIMPEQEETVNGNSGYIGTEKREDAIVRNKKGKRIRFRINRRPSHINTLSKSGQYKTKKREHAKSSVHCKVEHGFGVVKGLLKIKNTRIPRSAKTERQIQYHIRAGESDSI